MQRSKKHDGLMNRLGPFLLTNFQFAWRFVEAIDPLRSLVNRWLIRRAINKTKPRPHQFSLKADYTSWESLTNREFTGRHLPPADDAFMQQLPDEERVLELFRRKPGIENTKFSSKSTLLFTGFAQWFTDGFLRTKRNADQSADYRKNTSNHDVDLCQLYGLNAEMTRQLRGDRGRLKSSFLGPAQEEFPPLYFTEVDGQFFPKTEFNKLLPPLLPSRFEFDKSAIFAGGVERTNVTVAYAMFNTLFLREHNRVCAKLEEAYPTWDDDRLFETTRNIVIVLLLRITIEEYINHITPYHFSFRAEPWDFGKERWYRTNWMTLEFNLLYRWHSMIPNTFLVGEQHRHITDATFNSELLIARGLGSAFEDASSQSATEVGLLNTHEFLLRTEASSIDASRQARLRSYNDYRELFGFPRATSWDEISSDPKVQQALEGVYGHVDKLELYPGLFAEDVRPDSALPPLIGRMVGVDAFSQALTNPLLSVNVFNAETFSPVGLQIIKETTCLQSILDRNTAPDAKHRIGFTKSGDEIPEPAELDGLEPRPRVAAPSQDYLKQLRAVAPELRSQLASQWIRTEPQSFFAELRAAQPVLKLNAFTLVTRYADVCDVLNQTDVYSVRIYGAKMDDAVGPYMLGRDGSIQNYRDKSLMRVMMELHDLTAVERMVHEIVQQLIPGDVPQLDVVKTIGRDVPVQICDRYFGFPGPDVDTMKRWSKACQTDFFKNLQGDEQVHADARQAGAEMKPYLANLIAERRMLFSSQPDTEAHTVVDRLVKLELAGQLPLDSEELIVNIAGLLIGSVETTSQAIAQALQQILIRPEVHQQAIELAAASRSAEFQALVFEALRFHPINPLLFRYTEQATTIAGGTTSETTLEPGTIVFACTSSAMMDEAAVDEPHLFRPGRPTSSYFHFGYGHHECLGRHLGAVMVTETIRTLIAYGVEQPSGTNQKNTIKGFPFPEEYVVILRPKAG